MPRIARVVLPRLPHHVVHRGNDGRDIFRVPHDRRIYLASLRTRCRRHDVRVLAWCLMTNHVHLVLIPDRADALALAVGQAHLCYARYRNDRYAHKGHLWEGRYFSCPMDEDHCVRAIRYVEQNPVRAGIAVSARAYPWSSASAHAEGADPHNLLDMDWWKTTGLQSGWARNLDEGSRQPIDEEIRDRTNSGRPLGSDAFVDRLERELGRRLRPGRPGRPRQRP